MRAENPETKSFRAMKRRECAFCLECEARRAVSGCGSAFTGASRTWSYARRELCVRGGSYVGCCLGGRERASFEWTYAFCVVEAFCLRNAREEGNGKESCDREKRGWTARDTESGELKESMQAMVRGVLRRRDVHGLIFRKELRHSSCIVCKA